MTTKAEAIACLKHDHAKAMAEWKEEVIRLQRKCESLQDVIDNLMARNAVQAVRRQRRDQERRGGHGGVPRV